MINWQQALRLYFVAGTQDIEPNETLEDVLQEAIDLGITCFQLREKGQGSLQSYDERIALAKRLQSICQAKSIPFIINDDVDMAIEIGADAIHVGQSDKPILETVQLAKQYGLDVGLSVNTMAQLNDASHVNGLDYVGLGPVFPTNSKSDAEPAIGLNALRARVQLYPMLPKVAIGGIAVDNAADVLATGIDGIAVISAITRSENRAHDMERLLVDN